jgi:membrane-associated phospholipid phosphatase
MRRTIDLGWRFCPSIAIVLLLAACGSLAWTSNSESGRPWQGQRGVQRGGQSGGQTEVQSADDGTEHTADHLLKADPVPGTPVEINDKDDEKRDDKERADKYIDGKNEDRDRDNPEMTASGEEIQRQSDSATPVASRAHRRHRAFAAAPPNQVPCFCVIHLTRNLALDQKMIWTSPLRLRAADRYWLVPAALGTFGLVTADNSIMRNFARTPLGHSNSFSNYGLAGMIGGAASIYLSGVVTHDDHSRESGLLAGEAAVNSVIVAEALKAAFERQRPNATNGGSFWAGGASFPSEHAIAAWSIATVIAHEYPGPLTKLLAYGAASGITLARVAARDHFPSDVVVGSTLGYLIGRYVYGAHHDTDLPGANVGTLVKRASGDDVLNDAFGKKAPRPRSPSELGSPSVPLDSWVYAAFDRMAALGYAPSGYANLRPWTRMECARLLAAASDDLGIDSDSDSSALSATGGTIENVDKAIDNPNTNSRASAEAIRLYKALQLEFSRDLDRFDGARTSAVGVDSIYTRYLGVAGTPLADGYHFGQTLINDFGRPYGPGSNLVSGASASGSAGPFASYIRGEYQHAAALPAYSQAVQQTIGSVDVTPPQDPIHTTVLGQFRLLDARRLRACSAFSLFWSWRYRWALSFSLWFARGCCVLSSVFPILECFGPSLLSSFWFAFRSCLFSTSCTAGGVTPG